MRKPLLLLFLLSFCFYGHSQEAEETASNQMEITYGGKNELKLNGIYLLLGFPELSYERILNEEAALGISVAFAIDDVFEMDFMAIPYYRVYFGKKPAAGFFVEGNAALYVANNYETTYYDDYTYEETSKNVFGAGLGLAVGVKFITKRRWIFEIFGGAGRNFLSADEVGEVYPRMGLIVGKRF